MYQIRKGWPDEGAIDEVFEAATGVTLTEGMCCYVGNGEGSLTGGSGLPGFIIGREKLTGKFTALMTGFVVECDDDHYDVLPAAGDELMFDNTGKFTAVTSGSVGCAKVLSADSTTGMIRVLWN